ncbi:LuxR family transcriptional regulator [Streptomyces kurssanovii]|nr:LuxR family transcriptional regulator [Streptomyces kurssanovii]
MWTSVGGPEALPASSVRRPGHMVGREQDAAALRELLTGHRLVTTAGSGGMGKSRLAATVAASVTDGPWQHIVEVRWQGNGPASSGALAATVVLALTGVRPAQDTVGVAEVVRGLPDGRTLLFLDDVDPVHTECIGLVQHLLMAVPDVRVLVTARRPLGLGDERVLRLTQLSGEEPVSGGGRAPAVKLFLDRARAADEGFRAEEADLPAVAEVCRLLEGVPLAIEMAAEQTVRHSVDELAGLLREQQGWLTSPRPVLRRHRSLREAVAAGYVLCEREVRIVWARASVFAGPFAEGTAVFLCAGGSVEAWQVPGCLARLTAAGVLEAVGDPGGVREPRYRMTRAAREFGEERLRDAGEFQVAAERLVVHCRRVAAVAESLWSTGGQTQAMRLVLDEQDDLRAMVEYARDRPEHSADALETVVNLWFWWVVYDRAEEGREYLLRLLPLNDADDPLVTRALWLAAWLSAGIDPETARVLLGRAWSAAVMAGDDAAIGRVAHVQGTLALQERDAEAAARHFQEAADTVPPHAAGGPSPAVSQAAVAVAEAMFDPVAARRSARRALTRPGVREDAWASVVARYARAFVDHRHGRSGRAWQRAHRTLASLQPGLPDVHGAAALRRLMADIEAGIPGRLCLPAVPLPRTGVPVAPAAASRAPR